MKTVKMFAVVSFIMFAASGCLTEVGGDEVDDEVSEVESDLVGPLTCTSRGPGFGDCYASAVPTGWTISSGPGIARVTPSGIDPKKAGWYCKGTLGTRTVTAVGVGSATVQCAN